jgi:adenine/guanine phosphoribosyltransferase-like PRPP-binding protein
VDPVLLVVCIVAAWLAVAALLALALGRVVAVARVRDEHQPPRTEAARVSLARRTTTVVLGRSSSGRAR